MKKLSLTTLYIISSIGLFITGCATTSHRLNFNDKNDVITCSDGKYTLTLNSTYTEIKDNCKLIGYTKNKGSAGNPEIEFWGDFSSRVICEISSGKEVHDCRILSY